MVDNGIAIPNVLQKPILAPLHRSHAGQLAMVDTAQYIWWPRMHRRDIVQLCEDCPQCTMFDKNLKANLSYNSSQSLPQLSAPNEEIQLDSAGPLPDYAGNQIKILVAIVRDSNRPRLGWAHLNSVQIFQNSGYSTAN